MRKKTSRKNGGRSRPRLFTDNNITNACRPVQPVVTEYQVVRETGSKAHTVTATDEIDKVHEMDEMESDDSGKVYQVNKTAKLQQDEQERAHQVNERPRCLTRPNRILFFFLVWPTRCQ